MPSWSRMDDADIGDQVSALRAKLLAALPQPSNRKPTDTHAMAAAKRTELAKMARALGTRADYQEGEAFDREKQEEHRLKRNAEREERERRREEDRQRMAAQKAKWEEERKERDRLRRREEDRLRREREQGRVGNRDRDDMPPPSLPGRRYHKRERPGRRNISPQRTYDRGRGRSLSGSRSRSPPRRKRRVTPSPSPPRGRERSASTGSSMSVSDKSTSKD